MICPRCSRDCIYSSISKDGVTECEHCAEPMEYDENKLNKEENKLYISSPQRELRIWNMKFITKKQVRTVLEYCINKLLILILFVPAAILVILLFLLDGDKNGPRTGYWRRKKGW